MAETTPKWDATRVFILVIVVVFFVSSLAISIAVIAELVRGDDDTATTTSSQETENQEGKLEGTKLANFTPIETVDELQIIDTKEGTGEVVKEGDTVTAHYTGALAKDGTIFQSSHDSGQPIPFSLDSVIEGWKKGVPGMKVGGERRLIIPAALAYGANAQGNIPANSALVFDIELVKIGE